MEFFGVIQRNEIRIYHKEDRLLNKISLKASFKQGLSFSIFIRGLSFDSALLKDR